LAARRYLQVTRPRRQKLAGELKSIGVLIGLDLDIQNVGITTEMLRPDIEARLK